MAGKTHNQIASGCNLPIAWCKWIILSSKVSHQLLVAMVFPQWIYHPTNPRMQSWLKWVGLGTGILNPKKRNPGGHLDILGGGVSCNPSSWHRPSSLEWLHCLAWRAHLQLKASGWEKINDHRVRNRPHQLFERKRAKEPRPFVSCCQFDPRNWNIFQVPLFQVGFFSALKPKRPYFWPFGWRCFFLFKKCFGCWESWKVLKWTK